MQKLNKTFKINPLYESDSYKISHKEMLAEDTVREYWTWIPRSLKHMPKGITKPMSAGQQLCIRYLHSVFQEHFFDQPLKVAVKFGEDMCKHIMKPFNYDHFVDLHKLGYLPIKIKSLKEGIFTPPNIPHMTGINTVDGYAWLGLYLETLISKTAWQLPTAATIAHKFKQHAVEWVKKTDIDNLWLTDYMCHDFHSRGGNPFTSIAVGLGHAMSNSGSDTLNVIPASRYYYDFDEDEVPIYSVTASEHSVSCTQIFTCGERQMLINWLKLFPTGILSIVGDTFNLWKLITVYLADPEIKALIISREGKLVIRPDSGNPVDIICGHGVRGIGNHWFDSINTTDKPNEFYYGNEITEAEHKGVIELLYDIFGGTVNKQGYKVLDSHIGAIYGDSINLERQIQMYERLSQKGFASTNIVLGVGSYTYVMLTRDSMGYAAKGAWFETFDGALTKSYDIYKDPVTDDGVKKSLKGRVAVFENENGEIYCKEQCSEEEETQGLLITIYEDGKFTNQTNLVDIRKRLA